MIALALHNTIILIITPKSFNHTLNHKPTQEWIVEGRKLGDMSEFYYMYLSAFGECLTDMEANGVRVDTVGHLKQAEVLARAERKKMEEIFLKWAAKYCADTKYMNIGSATQIGAFLFGHWEKNKQKETFREFDIDKDPEELKLEQQAAEAANPYVNYTSPDLKALLKERGLKLSGKKSELVERLMAYDSLPIPFQKMSPESLVDMCRSRGLSSDGELDELIDRLTVDSQFVQVSLSLSLGFKGLFLDTVGILCNLECCIRQLWCSSIILYKNTSIIYNPILITTLFYLLNI